MRQVPVHVWTRKGYEISTDPARLDVDFVHGELLRTYWAKGISREIVEKSCANSMVFGLYRDGAGQIGFARLVTDCVTFAYLCDVVITETERGKGLGKWLASCVVAHPSLQGLRRWLLVTRDAQGLYGHSGWTALKTPDKFMERHFPDVYHSTHAG